MIVPEDVDVVVRDIHTRLTSQQMEVMQLIACGDSYGQIGKHLGLTCWGVKKRVYSVCDAIGARNRIEALILLMREGIL